MTQLIFASFDHMALLADYHAPEVHAHLCSHLALAVNGSLEYETDSECGQAQGVFIGSDVRHTMRSDSPMLIFFFDETSTLGIQIKMRFLKNTPLVKAPDLIIGCMRHRLSDFASNNDSAAFDKGACEDLLGAHARIVSANSIPIDERIVDVLSFLQSQDSIDHDIVDALAARECLSKSRLSHLFTQDMGISLHRYLAFMKMKKAAEYIALGNSLTDAAIQAGFDSSSHLSSTVKRMFGISLTDVMRTMQA